MRISAANHTSKLLCLEITTGSRFWLHCLLQGLDANVPLLKQEACSSLPSLWGCAGLQPGLTPLHWEPGGSADISHCLWAHPPTVLTEVFHLKFTSRSVLLHFYLQKTQK